MHILYHRAAAQKVPYSVFADRVRDPLARRIPGGYLLLGDWRLVSVLAVYDAISRELKFTPKS
ncbi:hypothetical protein [Campylobacter rectus]|uniref:hypothetical protein n=1 Tax=Campylobacter rectus TaxID=203 RepID=UPI0023F52047|nr:hypothetical protein [Campylobacter rectus]